MASFANNFTKAYSSEKSRMFDEEERKADRAWRQEQQARQRNEWKEQDQLKTDLAAASKPMTMEQGAGGMVKPEEMDNRDVGLPENAALPNGGLMLGGYKVGGESFTDKAKANEALVKMNTPEAIGERQAMAYQQNGKIQEANAMRAVLMDMKLKQMGLSEAEAKHADTMFNRMLSTKVPMGKGWGANFAKFLTETSVGGLKGVNFEAVYSLDGKTFELVGTGPDGTKVSKGTFTEDDKGWANAMRQANSAPLETKIGYVVEEDKAKLAAKKLALEERKVAATEEKTDAMVYSLMNRGGGGGGGGRGGGLGGGRGNSKGGQTSGGLPDPMGGFDSKKAYAASVEMAVAEMSQPGKDGKAASPKAIARRATELYRAMEGQFQTTGVAQLGLRAFGQSARQAQTPSDLATLYQQGLQAGMTPAQMVSLEPRLSQLAQPKQEKASVTTQEQKPRFQSMAGAIEKPAYSPPANSPAGKAAANRAAKQLESMQKMQATKDAALAAIQSGDPMAADAVRGMPGFLSLPTEQKAQIQKIIFGR